MRPVIKAGSKQNSELAYFLNPRGQAAFTLRIDTCQLLSLVEMTVFSRQGASLTFSIDFV